MRVRHNIILFLTSILFFGSSFLAVNISANSDLIKQDLPLLIGDYLDAEYIGVLSKTHSPITASKQSVKQEFCNVSYDDNDKKIYFTIGNFHTSDIVLVADKLLLKIVNIFNKTTTRLKVLSHSEFSLSIDGRLHTYRYIGVLDKYIAEQTVVGRYRDGNGAQYSFSDNGVATFPSRSFSYVVMSDYTMSRFDHFIELIPGADAIEYGFKFVNDELQLFMMGGPMGNEPEPRPFVTLTRIKDE